MWAYNESVMSSEDISNHWNNQRIGSRITLVFGEDSCIVTGQPTLAYPCVGVHSRTSLMSSSLLLQQRPACLVHLTWMVFEMGGQVAIELMFHVVLLPGFVQDSVTVHKYLSHNKSLFYTRVTSRQSGT